MLISFVEGLNENRILIIKLAVILLIEMMELFINTPTELSINILYKMLMGLQ